MMVKKLGKKALKKIRARNHKGLGHKTTVSVGELAAKAVTSNSTEADETVLATASFVNEGGIELSGDLPGR